MLRTLKAVSVVFTFLAAGSWTIYTLEKNHKRREIYTAMLEEIALTKGIRIEEIPRHMLKESIDRATKLSSGPELYLVDLVRIAQRRGIRVNKAYDRIHTREDVLDHGMFI